MKQQHFNARAATDAELDAALRGETPPKRGLITPAELDEMMLNPEHPLWGDGALKRVRDLNKPANG